MNALELQQAAKFLKRVSDRAVVPNLEELHLTRAESIVLSALMRADRLSISDIVRQTLLPQSQVSTTIASLVKRQWVSIASDESDSRKTVASITPGIRKAAEQSFLREADGFLREALPELAATDIDQLGELITKIASAIRSRGEEL